MPISKIPLSSSNSGLPIALSSSFFNVVHTTGTSSTVYDSITIYASNNSAGAVTLLMCWGITSNGINEAYYSLPANSTIKVCDGQILTGDGSIGYSVSINPLSSNSVTINGWVNRIS